MVQSCQKRRGKEQRDEVQDALEACVREGAREMLAIASEEEVNGWDVEAIRAMQQNGSYYLPFGETRSGSVPTDKLFTGQRLDDTGLYYYNARYYDPTIGRFISPDPITLSEPLPNGNVIKGLTVYPVIPYSVIEPISEVLFINPQEHNRYSYCLNNPYKYTDPDGHNPLVIVVVPAGLLSLYAYLCLLYGMDAANDEISNLLESIGHIMQDAAVAAWEWAVDTGTAIWDDITSLLKSDKSRQKTIKSKTEVILKHQKKINDSPPNDPDRSHWEDEIIAELGNIQKELSKMGPNARKKALEILKDIFPNIVFQ